ncbi:MAG: polyprenyl synthetase family protein [Coprobacillus cateniformis]
MPNPSDYQYWTNIGFDLGLAFQIQDDILDVVGNTKQLGKKVGSDQENHKINLCFFNGY